MSTNDPTPQQPGTAGRRYPLFTSGQTLTRDDLNLLRDFLDEQDRLLGQAIGFGILDGLDAVLAPPDLAGRSTLTVAGGTALDQTGRLLRLDKALPVEDAAEATAGTAFDFVDPAEGGVTPVLVLDDEERPAPLCNESGCAGHSAIRIRGARVKLAAGRLRTPLPDFATEKLLGMAPLTIDQSGTVNGDFDALCKAVGDRLAAAEVKLSGPAAKRLAGLTIAGPLLPAIKQYRAAFLNHVFFAALDLLRVLSLNAPSPRDTATPGVALGWLSVQGGAPVWNRAYRHDFEPPAGMANALLGSGSLDPPTLMRNRLESLLLSYAEPGVPAPDDPPKTTPGKDDFHECPRWKKAMVPYWMGQGLVVDCLDLVFPPKKIGPGWKDRYLQKAEILKGPGYGRIDPSPLELLYDMDPLDFAQAGVISLNPALGADAAATANVIKEFMTDRGITPDVVVRTIDEARSITASSVQGAVSLGDTVILVQDQHNKVVEIRRVANQQALKSAGGILTQARTAAATAEQATKAVLPQVRALDTDLTDLRNGQLTRFPALRDLTDRVGAVVTRSDLDTLAGNLRTEFERGLARQDTQVTGKLAILQNQADTLRAGLDHATEQTSAFHEKVVESVSKVTAVEEANRGLVRNVDRALERVEVANTRVDGILMQKRAAVGAVGQAGLNTSLVGFLDSMQGSLRAAAPDDRRAAVETALAQGEPALDELRRHAEAEGPVTVSHAEQLASVVDSLVAAAAKAGLPRGEMTRLRNAGKALTERLRGPS